MVWLTMTAATALLFSLRRTLTYYAGLLGWLLFAAVLGRWLGHIRDA